MVAVKVYIPTPYRKHTGQQSRVEVAGGTVVEALRALADEFPGLRDVLFDNGSVADHLNIYVDDAEIRTLQGENTPLAAGAEVAIIPAMAGGGGPLLTEAQMDRYSRNILLKEVGVTGQRKLLDSKVLLIGAGGLGSPAALYLAAAGVGTLGIVDGDRVDISNLQRQILHFTHDIGRPKTQSARRHLEDINPDVRVITYQTVISSENAFEIMKDYDVVINGCDNFPTRYLVNDACVMLGKPLVDASILMWEAQAAVFMPGKGCYRCLYPTPPPPGSVPSCSDAGIIGAMAGHLGTWQALETVKILLGAGEVLDTRLLLIDTLSNEYRSLKRQRNPQCPVCGDQPTVTGLIDYYQFCGVPGHGQQTDAVVLSEQPAPAPAAVATAAAPAAVAAAPATLNLWADRPDWQVSPAEVAGLLSDPDVQWVDVREENEYANYRIPGIRLIPLSQINTRFTEISRDKPAIVVCEVGGRSGNVTQALRKAGYDRTYNLKGGMQAWINQQLPLER